MTTNHVPTNRELGINPDPFFIHVPEGRTARGVALDLFALHNTFNFWGTPSRKGYGRDGYVVRGVDIASGAMFYVEVYDDLIMIAPNGHGQISDVRAVAERIADFVGSTVDDSASDAPGLG